MRVLFGGGAPPDLFEAFEKRFGVRMYEGYGMSEIGLPLLNTVKKRRISTCGYVRDDYEVKVVDDFGLEVGPNTPGELLLRPKKPFCMFLEYYQMPEQTLEACRDLWFHTGDYLTYDEDGYFHFVDRKKDAIRRRGENISSFEVEKVIRAVPQVLEVAAVAVKSDLGEDEVMVCLTLKPGPGPDPGGIDRPLPGKHGLFHGAQICAHHGGPAQDPDRAGQEIRTESPGSDPGRI